MRAEEKWIRRFYADIWEMGHILFHQAKTAKGAKRLLRGMQARWISMMDHPERHPEVPHDEEAYALLNGWSNRLELYWKNLFHCYSNPHIPATNNEMERVILDLKQLERILSRSPRPGDRFIRHAATNAMVVGRPELPGETFLVRCGQKAIEQAVTRLRAQRKQHGIGVTACRDWPRARDRLLAQWKEATGHAPAMVDRHAEAA